MVTFKFENSIIYDPLLVKGYYLPSPEALIMH